ncbi:DUF1778 domain-containing protein [Microbispora sp. NPDC046933]|uniref:type II toxin -antitoxin system TacA 1-like antitoxin n=1 Tax=Microbispora sp. NPDC046933 TaxID=3155618 RepID=UPI0033DEFFCD
MLSAVGGEEERTKLRVNAETTVARELPADRTVFRLDEDQWQAFDAALSRESRDVPGLAELMRTPPVPGGTWDGVIGAIPGFTEAVDVESGRDSRR